MVYNYSNSFTSAWNGESLSGNYKVPNEGIYKISSSYSPSGSRTHNNGTYHLLKDTTVKTIATNNNSDGVNTKVSVSLKIDCIYSI